MQVNANKESCHTILISLILVDVVKKEGRNTSSASPIMMILYSISRRAYLLKPKNNIAFPKWSYVLSELKKLSPLLIL